MKKRFLACLLLCLMVFACAGAEDGSRWQGFRGLPWGSIEEEIAEKEERVADRYLEISELCLDLVYTGMVYEEYTGAETAYILYDGVLVCAGYMIPGAEEEAMAEALKERFGLPNADGRLIFRSILSLVRPEEENSAILQKSPTAWNIDGTGMILYAEDDRLILLCIGLDYMNSMEDEEPEIPEDEEEEEQEEPDGPKEEP